LSAISNPSLILDTQLAEMFAARKTGELRRLTKVENAVWGNRLFVEMGLIDSAPIGVDDGKLWVRTRIRGGKWSISEKTWNRFRVLTGFYCLAGVHWLTFYGRPVAFTRHYAAQWCGVGVRTAYEALRWLERQKFLEPV
jgi:hypothetical protein